MLQSRSIAECAAFDGPQWSDGLGFCKFCRGKQMRGPHDIGGLPGGPVDTTPHDMTFWEKQIDALNLLLSQKGLRKVDENRRYIEMLGHDAYNTLSYYERWTAALARQLIDKGVFTQDEVDAKVAEIRGRLGEDAA
jgi:hypothetical protein